MSAPDTNIELQEERHKPALIGIKAAMVFGGLMMIAILGVAMLSTADSGATAYNGEPVVGKDDVQRGVID